MYRICMQRRRLRFVLSLGQEDPLEKRMASVFLPGESRGQRSLAGYSVWGCKGSDTTERLMLSTLSHPNGEGQSAVGFISKKRLELEINILRVIHPWVG